ncbi:hypothetical protein EVAR_51217_1 [Eumeta japonica]|uniref:Uncharacterized protein n=1 Tax=Eumeta variegata TaxID=151549 RepID=A0A4C1ZBA1_EUMVA|nr:hypothetical protein EVAR_51217_1 [Eumeta japonica]
MPIGPYLDRVRYVCSKFGTDKIILAAAARESDVGVFTALEARTWSGSIPRPEPRDVSPTRLDAHPMVRLAAGIETLAMKAKDDLEGLKNISPDVKESVIGKLAAINELALHLEESRSSYIVELERERTKKARETEAAEKRIAKIAMENLDRILKIENKLDKMAGEVSSTRNLLGHFDVPEKLEAIQKRWRRDPPHAHSTTPKRRRSRNPWLPPQKYSCRPTQEGQEQKVVVSCSSADDAKKIEERLKMREADLKVSKPEKRLPTVVIRDVLRVNTDEDVVKLLRIQNRHITKCLDWDKERAKVCCRRRARNDVECHPVLESPLVQCSRCLGFGHGKQYCKNMSYKCAHCREDHVAASPGAWASHHDVLTV